MCDVHNIWLIDGVEIALPCADKCKGLCHYDQKVADGLMEPSHSDIDVNKLTRKQTREGVVLWSAT